MRITGHLPPTDHQSITTLAEIQTTTQIHTGNQFKVTVKLNGHVFGPWADYVHVQWDGNVLVWT